VNSFSGLCQLYALFDENVIVDTGKACLWLTLQHKNWILPHCCVLKTIMMMLVRDLNVWCI